MADPVEHIKDGYFFDVPKFLWQRHWTKLEQVPQWVRNTDPEVKNVEEWNEALTGKVLIPQWFGQPKNLLQPGTGFCLSRYMVLEAVAAIIVGWIFIRLANKIRHGAVPRGGLWNMAEGMLFFLRDKVAKPAIGEHDADRFVPLLWTMFLFILMCNLLGMIPWLGSPTAAFGATLGMAAVTLLTVFIAGMYNLGPFGFWLNMVPHIEVNIFTSPALSFLNHLVRIPLQFFVFLIEAFGLLIRHGVLAIRLLANMVAGHLVLIAILGGAIAAAAAGMRALVTASVISVIGAALLSVLELFVAFLQAYVFTFLSALFIGSAIHQHGGDAHH